MLAFVYTSIKKDSYKPIIPSLPKAIYTNNNIHHHEFSYCLIREIGTSTASLHDSQIDLSIEGEVVFRDRGYFGVKAKGIDFAINAELLISLLVNSIKNATG
jgi:hypothetical protein